MWDGVLESGPWENEGRVGYERPEVEWAARQWKNLERVPIVKWQNPYLTYIKLCVGSPVPQEDKEMTEGRIAFEEKWWSMKLDASPATKLNKD